MNTYTPTEADKLTGARLRQLRKRRGETMIETIERSGIALKQSAFSRTELGQRPLTEIEAAKLAAHFNVAVSQLLHIERPFEFGDPTVPVETEQTWLGNDKPALFALPTIGIDGKDLNANFITIERDNPMTPEQYRLEVWVPYLEARYAADQQKTA